MKHKLTVATSTLVIVLILTGFLLVSTVLGSNPTRLDPTEQQQTVDAAVNSYFTQTASAQQQLEMTQTVQAAFDQALTATAAFQATVDAQFAAALTATAGPTATLISEMTATAESRQQTQSFEATATAINKRNATATAQVEYENMTAAAVSTKIIEAAMTSTAVFSSYPDLGEVCTSRTSPFRVAVVMPSASSDFASSQAMYEALASLQAQCGADNFQFAVSENVFVIEDAVIAIRDYATQGYDLVIAHGSQYGSSLQEIAPDFPETSFAWGNTVDTFVEAGIENVYAYEVRSEEGGYVNGVMAAMLTRSNIIGVIGPIEFGENKLYADGFIAGAKSVNPEIEILVNWIGSFSDFSLARAAAEAMIADGADVLTGTAQMVPGAIDEAREANVLWFGTQWNQSSLAPKIVVANQVNNWTVVLGPIIRNVADGELGGEVYSLTLQNGGLRTEYNPDFAIPQEVRDAADMASLTIMSD